jgi:glycine/serine hydroxymethyltransferase
VTGGTDNHLVLVDLKSSPGNLTGSKGKQLYYQL